MKPQSSQSARLFLVRPLPETPRRTRRYASLDLSGLDQTDFADSALRFFLVVCLVASMLVCGRQWSAATTEAVSQPTAASVALAGAPVPSTPDAPAPKVASAVRRIL